MSSENVTTTTYRCVVVGRVYTVVRRTKGTKRSVRHAADKVRAPGDIRHEKAERYVAITCACAYQFVSNVTQFQPPLQGPRQWTHTLNA